VRDAAANHGLDLIGAPRAAAQLTRLQGLAINRHASCGIAFRTNAGYAVARASAA
jgi:hypothetical protein